MDSGIHTRIWNRTPADTRAWLHINYSHKYIHTYIDMCCAWNGLHSGFKGRLEARRDFWAHRPISKPACGGRTCLPYQTNTLHQKPQAHWRDGTLKVPSNFLQHSWEFSQGDLFERRGLRLFSYKTKFKKNVHTHKYFTPHFWKSQQLKISFETRMEGTFQKKNNPLKAVAAKTTIT